MNNFLSDSQLEIKKTFGHWEIKSNLISKLSNNSEEILDKLQNYQRRMKGLIRIASSCTSEVSINFGVSRENKIHFP